VRARELIAVLPKAELHLHIEGAVPWATVRASSPSPLPEAPPWWAEDFRFDDFGSFRQASHICIQHVLTRAEAYTSVAAAIFADLRAQNVRYVEISFDAELAKRCASSAADVVAAIRKAAPAGLVVRVFGGLSQHKHDRTSEADIQALLAAPGLDGIDLHGDESWQTAPRFAGAFAEARRRGLATKAHAGELVGPASILMALDVLGVRRIEHGVRAVEDDALVARLARDGVTLDMCPWSNVKLRVHPDFASHPIRRLRDRGVRVTVSTDDPTLFGRSLTDELTALVEARVLSLTDIVDVQVAAFEAALLTPAERSAAIGAVREAAASAG
jgi:adenosine deaminase